MTRIDDSLLSVDKTHNHLGVSKNTTLKIRHDRIKLIRLAISEWSTTIQRRHESWLNKLKCTVTKMKALNLLEVL